MIIMVILIIIIIIIIFLVEIYSFFNLSIKTDPRTICPEQIDFKFEDYKFHELTLDSTSSVELNNCYVYTNDNENLFIVHLDEFILMKPGKVYHFDDSFKLEFIFTKNQASYFVHQKK
jgi:hypothetical protein